jgi:hypothetical protein
MAVTYQAVNTTCGFRYIYAVGLELSVWCLTFLGRDEAVNVMRRLHQLIIVSPCDAATDGINVRVSRSMTETCHH